MVIPSSRALKIPTPMPSAPPQICWNHLSSMNNNFIILRLDKKLFLFLYHCQCPCRWNLMLCWFNTHFCSVGIDIVKTQIEQLTLKSVEHFWTQFWTLLLKNKSKICNGFNELAQQGCPGALSSGESESCRTGAWTSQDYKVGGQCGPPSAS